MTDNAEKAMRRRDIQGSAVWFVFSGIYAFLAFGSGATWAPVVWFNACAFGASFGMLAFHVLRFVGLIGGPRIQPPQGDGK